MCQTRLKVTGEGRRMRFGFTASCDRRIPFPPFPKAGLSSCLMPVHNFIYNNQHLKLCLQPNADFQALVCSVGMLLFSTLTERQMVAARVPLSLEVVKPWSVSSKAGVSGRKSFVCSGAWSMRLSGVVM